MMWLRRGTLPLVVLVCLAAWSCGDSAPSKAEPPEQLPEPGASTETVPIEGAFAFANEAGTELLSLEPEGDASSYSAAVCGAGRFRVRFVRSQDRRAESTGRQVAANFDNEAGSLFHVEGGTATPDETCFLTSAALLARVAEPSAEVDTACHSHHVEHLAQIAGRAVVQCWPLAALEDGSRFLAMQFANADTSALAGLALARDSVHLFFALPGRYDGPGESSWRVDDGGVFDPGAIRLLFAAHRGPEYVAAFLWAGAEGESAQLVVADSSLHARSAVDTYRYWSPM